MNSSSVRKKGNEKTNEMIVCRHQSDINKHLIVAIVRLLAGSTHREKGESKKSREKNWLKFLFFASNRYFIVRPRM